MGRVPRWQSFELFWCTDAGATGPLHQCFRQKVVTDAWFWARGWAEAPQVLVCAFGPHSSILCSRLGCSCRGSAPIFTVNTSKKRRHPLARTACVRHWLGCIPIFTRLLMSLWMFSTGYWSGADWSRDGELNMGDINYIYWFPMFSNVLNCKKLKC